VGRRDGCDTASTLEVELLPKLASRSDAVLHAALWGMPAESGSCVSATPLPPTAPPSVRWRASYRAIDEAVQLTGGTLQRSTQAPEALASILADFRSSYILRYVPRGVPLAGWHELQVKIARPGSFRIRARKGYEGG
jgi:hypothetical protein